MCEDSVESEQREGQPDTTDERTDRFRDLL